MVVLLRPRMSPLLGTAWLAGSKPPPVVSCVCSLQVGPVSVDERAMHGEVLEFAGLGEPVSLAQCAEVVAVRERFEDLLRRAGIDQDDPVRRRISAASSACGRTAA